MKKIILIAVFLVLATVTYSETFVNWNAEYYIDYPDDRGCWGYEDLSEEPDCMDGLDNDGDGLVDKAEDPGCYVTWSQTEEPQCDDGDDNDGDGLTDYPDDPNCWGAWGTDESWAPRIVCGLGAELTLVLAPLMWLARRRRRRLA